MDIPATTYLINHGEIEFSTEYQQIKNLKKGKVITLQPKESSVLEVLCRNANRYLSKERLLNLCWSTYVEEGALSRVISLLRKYFKVLGASGLIVNKPKLGYMLESHVQTAEEAKKAAEAKRYGEVRGEDIAHKVEDIRGFQDLPDENVVGASRSNILSRLGKIAAFTLIVSVGVYYWFDYSSKHVVTDSIPLQFDDITPVFDGDENVQYQHPSISPYGNKLIYSKSDIQEENWELEWKDLNSLDIYNLAKPGKNLASPVWRDETSFAYHLYSDNECEIRLVTLVEGHTAEDELLHRCNPETMAKSLAWKDHEHLLFTDSNSIKNPHQLFELNISTQIASPLKLPENYGRGVYGVFSNDERNKIALLLNNDWKSTDVEIYEIDNFEQRLDTFNVKRPLFSIGWVDDTSLVFQNRFGGLSVYDTSVRSRSSFSVAQEGFYSNPVSGGGKLAVLSGTFYVSKLFQLPLNSNKSLAQRSFNNVEKASQKVIARDGETLYFVSNRNGKEQVYRYGETSKQRVSNFSEDLIIKHLSFLRQKDVALISHSSGVDLYRYTDGKILNKLHSWANAETGCFYNDELYVVLLEDNAPDIYRIDIENRRVKSRITDNGADNCVVDGDKMYYSRYIADGIWSYQPREKDMRIVDFAVTNSHNSWFLSDNYLWYISPEDFKLKKVDLNKTDDPIDILDHVSSIQKEGDALFYTTSHLSSNEVRLLDVRNRKSVNLSRITSQNYLNERQSLQI